MSQNRSHKNGAQSRIRRKTDKLIAFALSKLVPSAIIGVTVYLILTGKYECPFYKLLGIPCAGCGMTRAYKALLRLDIRSAIALHPLFPIPALWAAYTLFRRRFGLKARTENILLLISVILFLVFWFVRLLLLRTL